MSSEVFIRRPILATVCSLIIILAGAICIPLLPIARYPELTPPSVTITAFYTGANAQAVESAVTTPIEQVVNGVEGMTYIQSSSTNSGVATINVFFEVGRDPDLAAVDVQNRVNQVMGRLPADVRTTGVTVIKNTAGFMGGLGFFSRDNRYSAQFISNYLDTNVRDALKRVPGVGNVLIFGERKYAMRVWLDPARLAARGVTAGDVVGALREQNLQVVGRRPGRRPGRPEPGLQPERAREGPAHGAGRVRERRREGGQGRRPGARARHRPRRAGGRDVLVQPALHRARGLRHGHPAAADRQRARRSTRA